MLVHKKCHHTLWGAVRVNFWTEFFRLFVYAPSRAFSLDMAFSSTFMQMTHLYVPVKPTES